MFLEQYCANFFNDGSLENIICLIRILRQLKHFHTALFVCSRFYPHFKFNSEYLNEYGLCLYYCKDYCAGINIFQKSLQNPLTEEFSKIYSLNLYKCIETSKNDKGEEQKLLETPLSLITFSITTCKRLDLFTRTMDSFLKCCRDKHLISRWICVDDNSTEEDRQVMKTKYPFFEFVWKGVEDKGHSKSMNIIKNMVDTPYLFHMEDDWEFITYRNYMSECLEVLEENSSYGQCLVNKNYAETLKDLDILGGLFKKTKTKKRYYEHIYEKDIYKFIFKYGQGKNCAYWPFYSLRPGLLRTKIFRTVGDYTVGQGHFEMEYANRYTDAGFKTAFLEQINCIHIGKLTNETNIPNAYDLNNEKQF